jgi:hypothetical protein
LLYKNKNKEYIVKIPKAENDSIMAYAKSMVAYCFRNTYLEDLHVGISPDSKAGDYSDVKVVSPYGEIPWGGLSRISDIEMKKLIKECVDKVYMILTMSYMSEKERKCMEDRLSWAGIGARHWDNPKIIKEDMI